MKMNIKLFTFLCFMAVFLTACDDDDDSQVRSDSVSTGEIFATFQVVSDGDSYVFAEAQLTRNIPPSGVSGSNDFITLVGGDELWLSAGPDIESISIDGNLFDGFRDLEDTQAEFKQSLRLRESYSFLFSRVIINDAGTWYSARLPQSDEGEYRFALFRDESFGSDARNSVVVLPQTYSITSPTSGSQLSRSTDDIVISWNNVDMDASVEAEVVTTCPDSSIDTLLVEEIVDDGSITIPAGDIDSVLLSGTCSTTINVRKVRVGEFDARFIGGVVSGYQIRRQVITTTD